MSEYKNESEAEDVADVAEITPTVDEDGNDTTDWKAVAEMNRDLALKNRGIAQRFKTKFEKTKEAPAKPDEKGSPKSDLGDSLGEKAFLAVNGIKGSDELDFVKKMKKETGRNTEDLLDSTYFQTELKDFREKKSTEKATPTGSKRSSSSSVNTVEYWLAKDELPPASEAQLRRDVVNAKMNKEKSKGQFYNS